MNGQTLGKTVPSHNFVGGGGGVITQAILKRYIFQINTFRLPGADPEFSL